MSVFGKVDSDMMANLMMIQTGNDVHRAVTGCTRTLALLFAAMVETSTTPDKDMESSLRATEKAFREMVVISRDELRKVLDEEAQDEAKDA